MKYTDEQVTAVLRGKKNFRSVTLPTGIRFAVRVLTEQEILGARIEAQAKFRELCKLRGWSADDAMSLDPEIHHRMFERQVVWRAIFDADTIGSEKPEPFFPSDAMLGEVDSAFVTQLFDAYLEHQRWVNPLMGLNEEGVKEVVEALKKGLRPEALLSAFEPNTLRSLVISLANTMSAT